MITHYVDPEVPSVTFIYDEPLSKDDENAAFTVISGLMDDQYARGMRAGDLLIRWITRETFEKARLA